MRLERRWGGAHWGNFRSYPGPTVGLQQEMCVCTVHASYHENYMADLKPSANYKVLAKRSVNRSTHRLDLVNKVDELANRLPWPNR